MNKKLVITYLEFYSGGHRLSWIESFLNASLKYECTINLWVPNIDNEFKKLLPLIDKINIENNNNKIKLKYLDNIRTNNLKNASINFFKLKKCLQMDKPDICFLANNFDEMLKYLNNIHTSKTKIMGILDKPFLHYLKYSKPKFNWRISLKRYFSHFLKIKRIINKENVYKIFLLDPKAVDVYNKIFRTEKFEFLPEFIDKKKIDEFNSRRNDKFTILFPGAIELRKGIFEFLDSLNVLFNNHNELISKIRIIFAGKIDKKIYELFYTKLENIKQNFKTDIIINDSYLSSYNFNKYFYLADIVIMPYISFVGTSGILINSALFKKPVVASEFGIIGWFCKKYNLGITFIDRDIKDLSDKIYIMFERYIKNKPLVNSPNYKEFIDNYTIPQKKYGEEILKRIINYK